MESAAKTLAFGKAIGVDGLLDKVIKQISKIKGECGNKV